MVNCKEGEAHPGLVDRQMWDLRRHRQGTAAVVVQLRRCSRQSMFADLEVRGCFLGCHRH